MSFRHGISRDIAAKRQHDRAAEQERKSLRIADFVEPMRRGMISHAKFLEVTRQILDGDAERIVRIGEEVRPDITTGDEG